MQIQPTPEQQEIIAALGVLRALIDCLRPVVERIFRRKKGPTKKQRPRCGKPE